MLKNRRLAHIILRNMKCGGNEKLYKFIYKALSRLLIAFWVVAAVLFAYEYVARKKLYPLWFKETVIETATEYGLEPALVFAVIKTESGFDENAVSAKGAKGLMQITDETGAYIAAKLRIVSYDLFEPRTNIRFGCYYLRYLLDGFSDVKTAIAAYNAGEGNVRNWLTDKKYSEDGVALKEIPYKETARYTEKICESFRKYKKLYGKLLDKVAKTE